MTKRPKKPTHGVSAIEPARLAAEQAEWDAYDRKVITAFLREAEDALDEDGRRAPFAPTIGRLVIGWLRARVGGIGRGART